MGIEVSYRRISPERFTELQSSPDVAEEFFYGDDAYTGMINVHIDDLNAVGTHLSIDKDWQAIHYLLTGEIAFDDSQVEPPLKNVVMGGTPTEWEATYGYVRYLTPNEVKDGVQMLNQIPQEDLRTRFDSRGEIEIASYEDDWDDETWNGLIHTYAHLVKFFNEAAEQDQVVLISSD